MGSGLDKKVLNHSLELFLLSKIDIGLPEMQKNDYVKIEMKNLYAIILQVVLLLVMCK